MTDPNLDLGAAERAKKSRDYASVIIPRSELHQSLPDGGHPRVKIIAETCIKKYRTPIEALSLFLSLSLCLSSDAVARVRRIMFQDNEVILIPRTLISKREKRVRERKGVTLRGKVPRKSCGECNYTLP